MSKTTRKEPVSITYNDGKIVLTGKTFTVSLEIASDQLTKVYWTGRGKGTATVAVNNED